MSRNTRQRNRRKPGSETYTSSPLRPKLPSVTGTVHKRGTGLEMSRRRAAAKARRSKFGHTHQLPKDSPPILPLAFYKTEQERSAYLNSKIRIPAQDGA